MGGFVNDFMGNTGADAARKGSAAQQRAVAQARNDVAGARDTARADLQPFTEFGTNQLSPLQGLLTPEGQFDYLQKNPLFQLALDRADRKTNNTFLSQGLEGDAREALANNTLLAAQPLLNNQTQNLFTAAGMGQNAAAGQGNISVNAGNQLADLATQGGNAQAAGFIGAANAKQQGIGNLLGLGKVIGGFV